MSAIHKKSSVTTLSEFDIFSVPPSQTSIDQDILTEHRPTSALQDSKAFIEFSVSSGIDEYIRLDRTWLYIKIRLNISKPLKAAVDINDWKNVSVVNNFMNSLFKQVDLVIGDRSVTLAHQTYPYKTDFEIKLGKSKEAKETYLTSGLWYEDNTGEPESINEVRGKFFAPSSDSTTLTQGKEVDLMGRIQLPMFEQKRALLGGCNIRIKLIPNDPSFYIMCKNTVRVETVDFLDSALFIHRSKISRPLLEGHLKGLEVGNAIYLLRESFVVPVTVNKGTMDTIIDNVHNGQLPKRAFVAFVEHNAYNGSDQLNPYNYQHFDLNYLAFFLNGIQYPEKAFTPDFGKGLYVREYLNLFEATNQDNIDSCINLNREAFLKGNNIFAVNFAPDLQSGCCSSGYVNPIKFGSLRLQVRFNKPLEKAITVLVYLDYDTLLEINQERNPIYEFN